MQMICTSSTDNHNANSRHKCLCTLKAMTSNGTRADDDDDDGDSMMITAAAASSKGCPLVSCSLVFTHLYACLLYMHLSLPESLYLPTHLSICLSIDQSNNLSMSVFQMPVCRSPSTFFTKGQGFRGTCKPAYAIRYSRYKISDPAITIMA